MLEVKLGFARVGTRSDDIHPAHVIVEVCLEGSQNLKRLYHRRERITDQRLTAINLRWLFDVIDRTPHGIN